MQTLISDDQSAGLHLADENRLGSINVEVFGCVGKIYKKERKCGIVSLIGAKYDVNRTNTCPPTLPQQSSGQTKLLG